MAKKQPKRPLTPTPTGATPSSAKKSQTSTASPKWIMWLVLAITAIVYLPSLQNDVVNWDDDVNLVENKHLAKWDMAHIKKIFSDDVIGNYNPLPILMFSFEKNVLGWDLSKEKGGGKPFHIPNLILHLFCTLFVYLLCRRLGLSELASGLCALLFGIHPMRVESVAWITERKDVLFGFFYLWALWIYAKWTQSPTKAAYIGMIVLAILGGFSKIQAVSLPLSMLCIDYFQKRPWSTKWITEKIPFFLISFVFGVFGIYMLKTNESLQDVTTYPFYGRFLIGSYQFCTYVAKVIFPYKMSPLYSYPAELNWKFYIAPIGFLGALAFVYWAWKKEYRNFVFAFLFFFVNVVFMLQFLGAGQGFLADRFTYIPYLGFFFFASQYWGQQIVSPSKKVLMMGIAAAYLVLCAVVSYRQIGIWNNGETLWTHVLKYEDDSTLAWGNRAHYYRSHGQFEKSLADYKKSLSLKEKGETYNSLGKLFFDNGKDEEALKHYSRGIEISPKLAELYVNRGAAYGKAGKYELALADLDKGIQLDPKAQNGYLNRSLTYFFKGDYEKAALDHTKLIEMNPGDGNWYFERGMCYNNLGRWQDALNDLDRAIEMIPKQGGFHFQRARAYMGLGNKAAAKNEAQVAESLGIQIPAEFSQQLQ